MEFCCSFCEYTSSQKIHVVRHINKKQPCGPGPKEIIKIPIDIVCKYCNKLFATKEILSRHQKDSCKHKNAIIKDENKILREKNKELERKLKEKPTTTINNQTFNIYINNYEDTNMEKITDKIYNKIIRDSDEAYQIIPMLIKHIHCNPDIPENHNIRLSNRNRNNRYLEIYRNNHWEIENKQSEIGNLISDKETNVSDWIAEKGEKYPEAMEKFNEYIEQKYDEETANLIRAEVELLLYNNRHIKVI